MTPTEILAGLASIDIDPVFLHQGMRLCYWCHNANVGAFPQSHTEDCPWAALRKRHRLKTKEPLPLFGDDIATVDAPLLNATASGEAT